MAKEENHREIGRLSRALDKKLSDRDFAQYYNCDRAAKRSDEEAKFLARRMRKLR